jgi:hypothetical protein
MSPAHEIGFPIANTLKYLNDQRPFADMALIRIPRILPRAVGSIGRTILMNDTKHRGITCPSFCTSI